MTHVPFCLRPEWSMFPFGGNGGSCANFSASRLAADESTEGEAAMDYHGSDRTMMWHSSAGLNDPDTSAWNRD
jgi:hypothetical protein